MSEQQIKEAFIKSYDKHVDDIFAYCYEQVAQKEVARYLTSSIFMRTWELVATNANKMRNIKNLLYKVAKEDIRHFATNRQHHMAFSDKLWNLTLSQR